MEKQKLKIALLYSGQLRSWKDTVANHQANIWQRDDFNQTEPFFYTDKDPNDNNHGYAFNNVVITRESFFPDPFKGHPYNANKAGENQVYNTYNQWLNNLVGFILAPVDRDVYVRIRPDLKFNDKLDFTDYDYSGRKIYIPQGHDYGGVNDQFAFGNREVMKIYFSVMLNHHYLYARGVKFHSETMQQENLNAEGVEIVRIGYPQHDIMR